MSPVKSPQEPSARDIGKKDKIVVAKAGEEDLPPGWTLEVRIRKGVNGTKKDRYYTDPVTGYIFRSLTDVQRYLKTGELGRLAKKPKNTETDKKIVEVSESKEQNKVVSSPSSETPRNKRPLEDVSLIKSKSESPQRASKRLAGTTIDAPPSAPEAKTRKATRLAATPLSPVEPKTRHARQQAGIEIEPPLTTPPEPKTQEATQLTGISVEPPPPPSSPLEPKTSRQDTSRREKEAQTWSPVVLAIQAEKIRDNDGNADVAVAAKPSVIQESLEKVNKEESKADKNQDLTPVSQPPPAIIPPVESAISAADSRHEKQELPVNNPTQESSINFCLNDFWTDPCIEFAVKTLTGAIPFGDLNKADKFAASPLEVPMEELWTDPCIEFAVKTLTGAIPVGEDPGIQNYLNHQPTASTSDIKGGLQKSGNIGFHQQVNNGQSRQRFLQ